MDNKEEIALRKQISVNRHARTLYRAWRNFENLPQILDFLENVMVLDAIHSTWAALISEGKERVVWDIEITEETENQSIEWHSQGNPDILHWGVVSFTRYSSKETLIQLDLHFFFPPLNDSSPHMMGVQFEERIEEDLRRFKLAIEASEFPHRESNRSLPEGIPLGESPRKNFPDTGTRKKGPETEPS